MTVTHSTCTKLKLNCVAVSVQLTISTEEARALLLCLGFVRRNIVLDGEAKRFRFVAGKPLTLTVGEGVRVDFLKDYIEERTEEAINNRPFNPFVQFF